METSDKYSFVIASDVDYERVFVEIYYEDKFVAQITQEEGIDNLVIEFPGIGLVESLVDRKVPFEGFRQAIGAAAKHLAAGESHS